MILLLMVFLATYFKLNSTNRINYLDNLPPKADFLKKYFNGSIRATTLIWKGRIMCLNLFTAHTRAKHDFSIGVCSLIIMEPLAQIVYGPLILIIVFLCKHTSNCILYDKEIEK